MVENATVETKFNIIAVNRAKKRKAAKCRSMMLRCDACERLCPAKRTLTDEEKTSIAQAKKIAAEKAAKEKAEKEAAEKVAKEKAEKAAKEKAAKEAAEKAAKEKAEKEAAEKAAKEKAEKEAAEKAAKEKAAKEAAEKAAKEKAKKEAAEKAAKEKAEKEAAEKAAKEKAEKEAAEKAAKEKAEKEAAEKAAKEKAEKEAAEKVAKEKAEKEAAEKAAKEKAEKEAAEKAAKEKAEKEAAEKAAKEKAEKEAAEKEAATESAEESEPAVAPAEKGFKLTIPAYAQEVLPRMATKRARKLIYTPKEVIFETSCTIDVAGKKNDEGIKVKQILDAEIKEGLKLGYLEKYDGLKSSEIKEEYENDTVYEIAEQEFKKSGLLLDGNKVKVFIYDWTGGGIHHVGYLPDERAAEVMPYLSDMDKYSFDICAIITGGKSKTITKDPATGKFTITKNKDGDYGIDIDITIVKRKD